MPFVTFEGEGSVEEIADRLFARLTPKQRETATAAILKANPRLKRITEVERGVVIDVPDIPALRPKAAASNQGPEREALTQLGAALRSYGARVLASAERDLAQVKAETAAVNSPGFTKAIARSEPLTALAKEARAALEARAKAAGDRRKSLETALGRASADIEARLK